MVKNNLEKNFQESNISTFTNYIYNPIKITLSITGIYFIWVLLHYFASHLYVRLCVPGSIYGFFISPFLIATPYCIGLRWLVQTGANTINNMWIIFGSWVCSNIIVYNANNEN